MLDEFNLFLKRQAMFQGVFHSIKEVLTLSFIRVD